MIKRSVLGFILVLATASSCQPSGAEQLGRFRPTEEQSAAYDREVKLADDFMKIGDFDKAIACLKNSQRMPHGPEYGEGLRIFRAVAKLPLAADGHVVFQLDELSSK
jgi:hypothetical protein